MAITKSKTVVACVLRSGGEYGPWHVAWLRDQCAKHLPGIPFVCFSDIDVPCERVRLAYTYPGWWSKLEVFLTDRLPGDVLYLDLDTVIVGNLQPLLGGKTTCLADFNRPSTLQSSIMYLTEFDRRCLWHEWSRDPAWHMERFKVGGDQDFVEEVLNDWRRWQDVLPGAFVSYKVDMKAKGLTEPPAGARVVVFHGQPRPWQVEANWIPKLP